MRNITKLLLIMGLLLTSCTSTEPLLTRLPSHTRNGTPIIQNQHFKPVKWWKRLNDPVLDRMIREALHNNNQIKAARANTLEAQAQLKAAQLAWLPTLNAVGNGFSGQTWDTDLTPKGILATSPALANQGNMQFHGYYTGFMPSYNLNIMQNISASQKAKASLDLQVARWHATRLSIISQISGGYFMLLGHRAQLHDQMVLIEDLKKSRQMEEMRYRDGASDLSAVIQVDKQLSNVKASLMATENSISQVENALQLLLNHFPGPIHTQQSIYRLKLKHLIPNHLPASVLMNRPDMHIAVANLNLAKSNVGIAYAQYFPNISLTGLLGRVSIDLSHLLSLSSGLWMTQVAAIIPIFNAPVYQQIKGAKFSVDAACFNYMQTLHSVLADVNNSLTNHQKRNEAYHYQFEALKSAKTNYQIVYARYKAGFRDFREVNNAKLSLDYAKLDLDLAKMQQLDSIVQVYQALAGGVCA